jgi:hypothetical protein
MHMVSVIRLESDRVLFSRTKYAVVTCRAAYEHGHLEKGVDEFDKAIVDLLKLSRIFIIGQLIFRFCWRLAQNFLQIHERSPQTFQQSDDLIFDMRGISQSII